MGKTESFEFLNELALAFRRGEKNARPQHTPILEGVRAVLAHLQSTGRLLSDDEMRLTAEQAEDVRIVLGLNGSQDIKVVLDAQARLRALFPATEPAGPCSRGVCSANNGHDGTCAEASGWAEPAEEETVCGESIRLRGVTHTCELAPGHSDPHFAPTESTEDEETRLARVLRNPPACEPAEEETKAEYPRTDGDFTVLGPEIFTDASGEFICWKGVNYVRQPDAASSLVVPAPTETEAWKDWPSLDAIPADVRTVWDKEGDEYRRRKSGGWKFRSPGGKWQEITFPLDYYLDYAPFTTTTPAQWDTELGTRNDWTLNEGADK